MQVKSDWLNPTKLKKVNLTILNRKRFPGILVDHLKNMFLGRYLINDILKNCERYLRFTISLCRQKRNGLSKNYPQHKHCQLEKTVLQWKHDTTSVVNRLIQNALPEIKKNIINKGPTLYDNAFDEFCIQFIEKRIIKNNDILLLGYLLKNLSAVFMP